MLELEAPNLHEIDLDRVIAFGHTWSPTLELTPPEPFFHGHAINIDMALSTTLAEERGYISVGERDRVLAVMSELGLALDSEHLTPELLSAATTAILKTRDGMLRAAVPAPIGRCIFLNDVTVEELAETLVLHKKLCMGYPRGGDGIDMFTVERIRELPCMTLCHCVVGPPTCRGTSLWNGGIRHPQCRRMSDTRTLSGRWRRSPA